MKNLYASLALASFFTLPQLAAAQPRALQDNIQVRKLIEVPQRTMRIAKDPRDKTLYTLTATGSIFRIHLLTPGQEAQPLIARGVRNADSGDISWTQFNPAVDMPEGVPLEAIRQATDNGSRQATNPVDNQLYVLNTDDNTIIVPPRTVVARSTDFGIDFPTALFIDEQGIFYITRNLERANAPSVLPLYSSADHGLNDTQGFAIGPDGSMYVGGNVRQGNSTVITVAKGIFDPANGTHSWSVLARTEPIPRGEVFNHTHPAVAVDPAGRFVYINSGSRTDHGELSDMDGQFPGLREAPLSSTILRVPANGSNIVIPAAAEALAASGFMFSDGHRNAFDLSFGPGGDLFSADNGPDRDMADEINWVREGRHYGFPWRLGGENNPQQYPDYDLAQDPLVQRNSWANRNGLYYNDPNFPPAPAIAFANPIINMGPDANNFRNLEGQIVDASTENKPIFTLTAHSSPTGIVFDNARAMAPPFTGSGFALRIGGGTADLINSFGDPDQDLLHLDLEKTPNGDNYQARVTRLVAGFDSPIDAEIIGNRIFVVEWGNARGLWEITLPMNDMTAVEESADALPSESVLLQNYPNPFNPNTTIEYQVEAFSPVELNIYDALGQKVRTLVAASQQPGYYRIQWDGRSDAGVAAASGVYIYQLKAGAHLETRRLTLIK